MRAYILCVVLLSACALTRCEEDDEDKPYKFGFNIEKYQHRLEEKNKKGLIKGEFGFVTGDGVYHETAYATDENGDFKILGMRSYFVGLPGLDLPDITKGAQAVKAPSSPPPAPKPQPLAPTILSGIMGCSSCIIPETVSAQSGPLPVGGSAVDSNGPFSRPPSAFGGPGAASAGAGSGVAGPGAGGAPGSGKPSYTAVDDEHANIKVGGFSPEDMKALLYRFNYTLGYHGHHEVGDRAGNKRGDYHFDGRDGLERQVKYTANEFGYQPNITLHELRAEQTPRQETEKDEKYAGLKGYEFVWFNDKKVEASLQQRQQRQLFQQ